MCERKVEGYGGGGGSGGGGGGWRVERGEAAQHIDLRSVGGAQNDPNQPQTQMICWTASVDPVFPVRSINDAEIDVRGQWSGECIRVGSEGGLCARGTYEKRKCRLRME